MNLALDLGGDGGAVSHVEHGMRFPNWGHMRDSDIWKRIYARLSAARSKTTGTGTINLISCPVGPGPPDQGIHHLTRPRRKSVYRTPFLLFDKFSSLHGICALNFYAFLSFFLAA